MFILLRLLPYGCFLLTGRITVKVSCWYQLDNYYIAHTFEITVAAEHVFPSLFRLNQRSGSLEALSHFHIIGWTKYHCRSGLI